MALRRKYLIARIKAIGFGLAIWAFITGTTSSCVPDYGYKAQFQPNFSADINGKHRDTYFARGIKDLSVNEIMVRSEDSTIWIFIDSTKMSPDTYENHHGIFSAGGFIDTSKPGSSYIWYTGELKITSINSSEVVGTFWFNANRTSPTADTVKITNGSFDVNIDYGKISH
jgi:hypothetical protein